MLRFHILQRPGIQAALLSALLFGASTPLAKILLTSVSPWMLAGLLYLGSGLGLTLYRWLRRAKRVQLSQGDAFWFGTSVLAGGIIAPVLFMIGLHGAAASTASLLLNAEAVFTTLLAWWVFKEGFDRRIAWGMVAIVLGMVLLSWPGQLHLDHLWSATAIIGACFAWGVDNNLTRKVSLTDTTWIAANKGWVAGGVNLGLALLLGDHLPALPDVAAAMLLGFFAYGVSLALFVVGLRHLGSARTGAYFSSAPFVGAALSVILGAPVSPFLVIAGALMGWGIWMHLTERHEHAHIHTFMEHDHTHVHEEAHHQHTHPVPVASGVRHRHPHQHEALTHSHAHTPDMHHLHKH